VALRVYNRLSGKLERFRPVDREQVRVFVSGPTVYDHAHLGHAKTYVAVDVISRYLAFRGYQVRCVRSFADLGQMSREEERRLSDTARRVGITPMELVDSYIWSFHDDMDTLGVVRPNSSPRASCQVLSIIAWIEDLVASGAAYVVDGGVYFAADRAGDYARLLPAVTASQQVGDDGRKALSDFPLWRSQGEAGSLDWQSPWGVGHAGWHVANSVIAEAYLGKTFDIHGGGTTHLVSQMARQTAQGYARNGVAPSKYWLVVGDLRVAGRRMSRALGNHLTIKDALKLYAPEVIRYFLLSQPYREITEYRREALLAAQRHVDYLHQTVRHLRWRMQETLPSTGAGTAAFSGATVLPDYRQDFSDAMDSDFDTAQALSVVFRLVEDVDRTLASDREVSLGTLSTLDKLFHDLAGGVLGILPEGIELSGTGKLVEQLIEALLDVRADYVAERDWAKADAIRAKLDEMGVAVQDGPHGPSWQLQGS